MKDHFLIFQSPFCDYSTAPWGVLKIVDGKVVLNEEKAFNRQRRYLHAGGNMSRILRSAPYAVEKEFAWEDEGYFPLLRDYLNILNHPVQGEEKGQGARVVLELFNGSSEKWMYTDHPRARRLVETFFNELKGYDFVDYGAGNECNNDAVVPFFEKVIIPAFDAFDKIPFSYPCSYNHAHSVESEKRIHDCKGLASKKWGDLTSFAISKQVHGCKDSTTPGLRQAVEWWVRHNMCTFFSVDGVFDGASACDFYQDQRRPSSQQFADMMDYVLGYVRKNKFAMTTGQVKFAFEFISKVWNDDACGVLPILAASEIHKKFFGVYPDNYGKYPNDWVEPIPPLPPEPPIPPTPPIQVKPCSYFWNRHNYWHWLRCILLGKH